VHFLNDFVLFSTIVYLRADCLLFYQSIVNESGETIVDVKDLAPSIDSKGNYEGFETLVDRANVWLREQRNVTILNMQSLMVQEMRQGQFVARSMLFHCCFDKKLSSRRETARRSIQFRNMLALLLFSRP